MDEDTSESTGFESELELELALALELNFELDFQDQAIKRGQTTKRASCRWAHASNQLFAHVAACADATAVTVAARSGSVC